MKIRDDFRTQSEDRADARDSAWRPIQAALHARNPFAAMEQYRAAGDSMKNAMHWRIVDWLVRELSLPSSAKFPWWDDQGLQRMIYMIWPEIPTRSFTADMLPDIFNAMPEYRRQFPFREGRDA